MTYLSTNMELRDGRHLRIEYQFGGPRLADKVYGSLYRVLIDGEVVRCPRPLSMMDLSGNPTLARTVAEEFDAVNPELF
ncbi:hypothetical protein HOD38_00740 [archaeon]|mgnify:FL=1|jgi:hypothetical protein|nr:hypothetical protein [archaeon]MBT4396772.1 hypothetical protein [archaeon]MBT4441382.1 hypothetical protein [archaeon]